MTFYIFIHFVILDLALAFVVIKNIIKQYKTRRFIKTLVECGKDNEK